SVAGIKPLGGTTHHTLLENWLPCKVLSLLISLDRRARDPSYAVHRWWARRPPALMRALLLASVLPRTTTQDQFWQAYSADRRQLDGLNVYDPFLGGGSTLIEARRLGADVSGGDIDPLAVRTTMRALRPVDGSSMREAGTRLLADLSQRFGRYYPES